LGHAGKAGSGSFAHGAEHSVVNVLRQIGSFLLDNTVLETEDLGLVVARDCGVSVHISGKEWQVLG